MYKIIINADDFGINEEITHTTIEMIERGAISSATIMANGECLDLVKDIAILHPEISYGVHLCLDEFKSLTCNPIFEQYGITDSYGIFVSKKIKELKVIPVELRSAIIQELEKQIETVLALGIPLSHVDSHHHWHMGPLLLPIFNEVVTNMKLQSPHRPIIIVADTFNRIVFVSQGYSKGLGEQLVKVIHQL